MRSPKFLSLLFVYHRPATLEQLQQSLSVLLRGLRSLAGETRRAPSLAVTRGHGYEFHHLQSDLVGVARGRCGVGTIFRHQSFILGWYGLGWYGGLV